LIMVIRKGNYLDIKTFRCMQENPGRMYLPLKKNFRNNIEAGDFQATNFFDLLASNTMVLYFPLFAQQRGGLRG
jgi:hypothetical protein